MKIPDMDDFEGCGCSGFRNCLRSAETIANGVRRIMYSILILFTGASRLPEKNFRSYKNGSSTWQYLNYMAFYAVQSISWMELTDPSSFNAIPEFLILAMRRFSSFFMSKRVGALAR